MLPRRALAFLILLAPFAAAQAVAQQDVARTAFGVRADDGLVRAMGPDFAATFTAGGVAFTPVLGAKAEQPASVQFALRDVRRGAVPVWERTGEVPPSVAGDRVCYEHGAGLTEVYDVRREGIEQSFVFAARPAGAGDLVVRGAITSTLPLAEASPTGVRFALPSGDGVSFGAVTGIDANGARAAGALRWADGDLELVLPASFVDTATYPLVLDPLIGAVINIGDVAGEPDRAVSVAYDEATNRHLVVWNVRYAASSWEVRGQFTNGAGQPLSAPPFTISAPGVSTAVDRCCAASVRGVGRFVVAMRPLGVVGGLAVRSISAVNGAMSAVTPLVTSATLDVTMATVGGDSRVGGNNALVGFVLFNLSNGARQPHSTMLSVAAAGTFTTVAASVPLTPNSINNPDVAVSHHGGLLGNWVAAWTDQTGSGAMRRVNVVAIGPTGAVCGPTHNIETTNSGADIVSEVACATRDGAQGLVTWTNTFGTTRSVRARVMVALGACGSMTITSGSLVVLPAGTGLRDRPAVDFAADKFVLAFRERQSVGGQARTVVTGLDVNFGTPAGAEHYPSGWLPVDADPTVTAKWSGGAASDEALVAWSDDSAIRAHLFEATGTGSVTSLGGACGITGFTDLATYGGTPALGTTFTIELASPTSPILALIIGFSQVPFACGPCTVVPSADILLPGATPTAVAVPNAPNLIGFSIYAQWLQLRQSGCPILPDFGFSNTLRFTIAE